MSGTLNLMRAVLDSALADAERLLHEFRTNSSQTDALSQIAEAVLSTFQGGGKILICGNGGSMADAMHFAEEWTGKFRDDRKPYPVIALADPTHITCVANDYGYAKVFARQIQAYGRPGDLLIVLSTSGRSASILEAAKVAGELGIKVAGLLGKEGGGALMLCDLTLVCPGDTSDRIQELHMLCLHAIIEAVEPELAAW